MSAKSELRSTKSNRHPLFFRRHAFPTSIPDYGDGISGKWLDSQTEEITRALDASRGISQKLMDDNDEKRNVDEESSKDVLETLSTLEQRVNALALARAYTKAVALEEELSTSQPLLSLQQLVRRCTKIGAVLYNHSALLHNNSNHATPDYHHRLYSQIRIRYEALYKHARARSILTIRRLLRNSGYPSSQGCQTVQKEIETAIEEKNADYHDQTTSSSLGSCASYLAYLQLMYDRLNHHHVTRQDVSSSFSRLELLDEFCRPIVERVQYHFLSNSEEETSHTAGRATTSSRLDRLPEWLFHYLRGIINDGAIHVIQNCIQPILDAASSRVQKSIIEFMMEETTRTVDVMTCLPIIRKDTATTYFLTEMIHIAQHVLRTRDFFRNSLIVGEDASPILLCRAIEQLLLFDAFTTEVLTNESETKLLAPLPSLGKDILRDGTFRESEAFTSYVYTDKLPRLVDSFVASDTAIFYWWIEIERKFALFSLQKVAKDVGKTVENGVARQETLILSTLSETFVSLWYSTRMKARAMSEPDHRQQFTAGVSVPLCMEFMEIMHRDAKALQSLLLSRRRKATNHLPSDEDLIQNMDQWIDIINGTHLASVTLLKGKNTLANDDDMVRVGSSFEQLRDAIVDDCTSAIVETILMERAKFASYLMRCAHMLSSTTPNLSEDKTLTLSPDLSDSVHILSIVLRVCTDKERVAEQRFEERPSQGVVAEDDGQYSSVEFLVHQVTHFGSLALKKSIADRVQDKLMEVALDMHGMIPDISYDGSRQFQWDVHIIAHIFLESEKNVLNDDQVLFGRLMDIVDLMAMEFGRYTTLRLALQGLVSNKYDDGDDHVDWRNDENLRYQDFDTDGTLMNEGLDMIQAQGFQFLDLSDAISIMNRRKTS